MGSLDKAADDVEDLVRRARNAGSDASLLKTYSVRIEPNGEAVPLTKLHDAADAARRATDALVDAAAQLARACAHREAAVKSEQATLERLRKAEADAEAALEALKRLKART
jgi:hypothetical protein